LITTLASYLILKGMGKKVQASRARDFYSFVLPIILRERDVLSFLSKKLTSSQSVDEKHCHGLLATLALQWQF